VEVYNGTSLIETMKVEVGDSIEGEGNKFVGN
jgi:hypothetical protein